MLLPVFNPLCDTSEFSYLQTDLLNNINHLAESINQSDELWQYTEEEYYFIREKQGHLREMNGWLLTRKPRKKKFQFTYEQSEQLQDSINHKQQWHQWLTNQVVLIHNAVNKADARHEAIKALWQNNQLLANYNHTHIYAIAAELLPKLIKHHQHASNWLDWQEVWRKPKQTLINYRKYLDNFQNAAQQLQQTLAESMLLRLVACDESHFRVSNPIVYFTYQLEDRSLLAAKKLLTDPCPLTDKEFNFFHWYIEKHGTPSVKNRLSELSWFKNQNNCCSRLVKTEEGSILVPEQMADDVPLKRYKPQWLFWSANCRLAIAQSAGYLIARLKKRRDYSQFIVDITLPHSYQYLLDELQAKENCIKSALSANERYRESHKSFIYSLLFNRTGRYLRGWYEVLTAGYLTIFEDRLTLCEMLINSVSITAYDKDTLLKVDKHSCDQLEHLVRELERLSTSINISQTLYERLVRLITQANRLISFNKALRTIDNLAQSKICEYVEYEFLVNHINALDQREAKYVSMIKKISQPYLPQIYQKLLQEIKSCKMPFDYNECFEKRASIRCRYALIAKLGTDQMLDELKQKIIRQFFDYLQLLLCSNYSSSDSYQKTRYFEFCAEIFVVVGDVAQFGAMTIADHLRDLLDLRRSSDMLWKIRCYSLIMAMANELLIKRFDKEATLLDEKLFGLLKSNPRFRYSDSTINILQATRNKLIDQELSCAVLAENLPKAEQMLMGINYPESASVQDIILATAEVYKTQQAIQNDELEVVDKIQKIKSVRESLKHFLHHHPLTKNNHEMATIAPGKSPWFSKYYLHEDVLSTSRSSLDI